MLLPPPIAHLLRSALFSVPLLLASAAHCAALDRDPEFDSILSMDIAELTVTSVSLREQKLQDAAAAIYVLTNEDIRRSGATSIPEALRMVPGLEVAQAATNRWSVSARGFNGVLAGKLQVLIDGRSVYTPVFSGTYWDDQSTPLEDIERIEVIRGPGGTLYGANAVNGVINIITRHAKDTQGNFVAAGLGTEERLLTGRHGGKAGDGTYYRTFAQVTDNDATAAPAGGQNEDEWSQLRAGFRMDSAVSDSTSFTLQGDAYGSQFETERAIFSNISPYLALTEEEERSFGGNLLARWNHEASATSSWEMLGYVDHYTRDEAHFVQKVSTANAQFRNNLELNDRNSFIWGGGARYINIRTEDTFGNGIAEGDVARHILNVFAQNEFAVIPDSLYLTLGSKFEHNAFTGFEVQPNARVAWHPNKRQTFWAAVSRAVRTPSEIEDQATAIIAVVPGTPPVSYGLGGFSDPQTEELMAYEIGHRFHPGTNFSVDTSLFYNDYDNLLIFDQFLPAVPRRGTSFIAAPLINGGSGSTYGGEIAVNWNVSPDWRLMGSYSYIEFDLNTPATALAPFYQTEDAPEQQFSVRSYWNVSDRLQWDNMFYYVDSIRSPADAYLRYDTRLGWQVTDGVEVSLIGRNLLEDQHSEFSTYPQAEIERSVLGMVRVKF